MIDQSLKLSGCVLNLWYSLYVCTSPSVETYLTLDLRSFIVPKLSHTAVSSFQVFLSTANSGIFLQLTPPLFMSSLTVCIQTIFGRPGFFFHSVSISPQLLLSILGSFSFSLIDERWLFSKFSCLVRCLIFSLRFRPSMRRVESCGSTDDALPPVSRCLFNRLCCCSI